MRLPNGRVRARVLNVMREAHRPLSASYFFRQTDHAKRGSIYSILRRLEKQGMVYSFIEQRRPGTQGSLRRLYTLTARGSRAQARRYMKVEVIDCPEFF